MESIKVKNYMNKRPVTFKANMSLLSALDKMLKAQQLGGPVVDENNKLVGFISEQDMMQKLLKVGYHCQDSDTVADCMHDEVVSVDENYSVLQLAEEMVPGRPKIYPVVDVNLSLVGSISRRDVLRALSMQIQDSFNHQL